MPRKKRKAKKQYFDMAVQDAIIKYNNTESAAERSKI